MARRMKIIRPRPQGRAFDVNGVMIRSGGVGWFDESTIAACPSWFEAAPEPKKTAAKKIHPDAAPAKKKTAAKKIHPDAAPAKKPAKRGKSIKQ